MVVGDVTNRRHALYGDEPPSPNEFACDVVLLRLGGDAEAEEKRKEDAEWFHGGQVYSNEISGWMDLVLDAVFDFGNRI